MKIIEPTKGSAQVSSSMDRTFHAVFARGRFDELYQGYLDHAGALGPLPDEAALEMTRTALSVATLQLALLPPDQFCSWTFNITAPEINLFLAGDNGDFQITGRVYSEHVKATEVNRLFVETQRPRSKPARSTVDFEGLDVLEAFRQYYLRSLQMRARIFELDPGDFLMIQGLPMVDRPWLAGLDAEAARALMDGGTEPIEDRLYRFRCGCDVARITAAVREMFKERPKKLFEGQDEVEVQCPRCGLGWTIARDTFTPAPPSASSTEPLN